MAYIDRYFSCIKEQFDLLETIVTSAERGDLSGIIPCKRASGCDSYQGASPLRRKLDELLEKYEDVINISAKYTEHDDSREKLIFLPLSIGDPVYKTDKYEIVYTPNENPTWKRVLQPHIEELFVTNLMISQNKKGEWTKKYRACNGRIRCDFSFDDIGREVFTTEYDAEYAIEEMKKNELSRNLSASDSE